MSNLYKGPSKGASYQGFDPFGQAVSEETIFKKLTNQKQELLWWPCLLTDRDEMSNLYREHDIDASYQVSVHLGKRFQRRRFKQIGQSETIIAYGSHVC
jgi:hypothetical protein